MISFFSILLFSIEIQYSILFLTLNCHPLHKYSFLIQYFFLWLLLISRNLFFFFSFYFIILISFCISKCCVFVKFNEPIQYINYKCNRIFVIIALVVGWCLNRKNWKIIIYIFVIFIYPTTSSSSVLVKF